MPRQERQFIELLLRSLSQVERDGFPALVYDRVFEVEDPAQALGTVPAIVLERLMWTLVLIGEMIMSQQSSIDQITSEVQTITTNLTAAVTALTAEIATLKTNAPALDLTNLDAALSALQSAANAVGGLAPTPPAPAPSLPVVDGLSPSSVSLTAGATVSITGTGFTGATSVEFGGVAATSFTVDSDTSISAVTPGWAAAGSGDTIVTTPAGSSVASSADVLTWS